MAENNKENLKDLVLPSESLADSEQLKKFVLLQVKRVITNLYKGQLDTISDLNQLYLCKLSRNKEKIPVLSYNDLSFWDVGLMGQNRKRTLDAGNDAIRNIEEIFQNLEVNLKEENKQ